MEFIKYQHIERFGESETEGIEYGTCFVFPKIDGTNSQLWWNGELHAGSRNRHLSLEKDNAGFLDWALKQQCFYDFFNKYPDLRLYGEWLVPHTLKTYQKTAWNKFYVFDVTSENGYMPYEEYKLILDEFDIDYIPPLCRIENPTKERLVGQLAKNGFLIEDGKGMGEGIVVKNYGYRNKYGRQTWAKIVANEFKAKHQRNKTTDVKEKKIVESEIVMKYVTETLVEKEYAKIKNEVGWSAKQIPRLLSTVFYCLIKEEGWNFVKQFKNPTIDFKRLYALSTQRVKKLMPQLF